ncbi:hypothetical protein GIB67_013484 [Kingdonia uniflora]|uniref:Uncharacterized protein n=1 Tax=Kingdonia uniflora TaxID=39325 RepID=A0A7J7LR64_9MAGN|nr:hypothetical protein GIB67_013484 [Kingdonia uniflora]
MLNQKCTVASDFVAEQLKLQLCLIDFKTGHKVSLTIDITCLHRGLYPSESLVSVTDAPESILDEVVKAVGDLKAGHSRIIRLCKCVIQVFQASSM